MRLLARLLPIVAAIGLIPVAPAQAAVPPFINDLTRAYLSNPQSGLVFDVPDASTERTAPIRAWSFHGGRNQQWEIKRLGEYHTIGARHSGMCLDVINGNPADGTRVWQWHCYGGDAQLWKAEVHTVDRYGYSTFRLVNKGSGKCLEIPGGVQPHGAGLGIRECHGGANQEWRQGNFLSQPVGSQVIDARGWAIHVGAPTWMWAFHGGADQEMNAWPVANSWATRFRFRHSGLCLGLAQRGAANGTAVVQVRCDLADQFQQWMPEPMAADRFGQPVHRYRNVGSGKCLDRWIHDQPPGARLVQWECHRDWNQQWRFA
ncbi:hypothetical protein DL991_32755 [Amycolatopsis sp. WAC 01375]|uniref:RICIN domain-containing protein n=1 Tax=Amycolatopsis sp. WAC 01375 TaxID=2203194 RepID=UPI000F7B9894|nr:RICIN domain-containing protein [Amycolatopsis sp. WAC 01375]RSM72968.1 hypothetical protein DL991_32755 [Amycolatopsis sp. WAC 01375]